MGEISRLTGLFVLNAAWQITVITAVALMCAKLLERMPSSHLHALWATVLAACVLIPATTVALHGRSTDPPPIHNTSGETVRSIQPGPNGTHFSFHSISRSISFSPGFLRVMFWAYIAFFLYGVCRLCWLSYRAYSVGRHAYNRALPDSLSCAVERCVREFSLRRLPVLCSQEISSPSTMGFLSPVLLLPQSFYTIPIPQDDAFSVVAHEFAHIRRRDFLFNLMCEMAYVTVCFHPCAALVMARIAQTREMACDEIAASVSSTPTGYARSLLHIAQSMLPHGRLKSNYVLGLFDTNTLEERIMNILKTTETKEATRKERVLKLITVSLLAAATLGLSAFSLRLSDSNNTTDLQRFTGTWEARYHGATFFTIKLALNNGTLGGTCVHYARMALVDGELIPDGTTEKSTDKILDTSVSGQKLLIKMADGDSASDAATMEFTLTGANEAEVRVVVESTSGTPAPKKPWHFTRVGTSH